MAKAIHQTMVAAWDDKSFLQPAPYLTGFNGAYAVHVPNHEHRPRLYYRYAAGLAEKLRFDFNPSALGPDGMATFHGQLKSLLNDGWEYVIEHGTVTRLDVAVDLHSVRLDDFLYLAKQGTKKQDWSTEGHLETVTYGVGKGNQTLIYNKKAEQIAKGVAWEGKSAVRIERRLRNPSITLKSLSKLKNPFSGTTLIQNFPPPPPNGKEWEWSMFEDSVRFRGVDKALSLLPPDRKAKYRKHLKACPVTWWDPELVWKNWPLALEALIVGDKAHFASKP
ncbi:hypothetical protein [Aurantimonas coralicida]|uniref:hypothetical protein n=1 Tax=Aurantimonas coralicida TaxID=182270 RepID=UPI001D192B6C|nr:hypothetical protein [Aurantimonas coralicida]MCC4299578.1 hypothetical protein [Aurantimonas coralicida]